MVAVYDTTTHNLGAQRLQLSNEHKQFLTGNSIRINLEKALNIQEN